MCLYSPTSAQVKQLSLNRLLLRSNYFFYSTSSSNCKRLAGKQVCANSLGQDISVAIPVVFLLLRGIRKRLTSRLGYVHTGPVLNGSDLKTVLDRRFVHTRPANHTVNQFPIGSDFWTSKKACPVLELFRS